MNKPINQRTYGVGKDSETAGALGWIVAAILFAVVWHFFGFGFAAFSLLVVIFITVVREARRIDD